MPGSGHAYFTLKDQSSQLRAVLFRSNLQCVRFLLKEGMHLLIRGRLSVYEPRGEYQVVVEQAEPRGIGALQLAWEQLKERLCGEGLFEEHRKRPLPRFPSAVGIVTSLSGSAVRDIVSILCRRCPTIQVVIAPVPVQGEGAANRIAAAIRTLGDSGLVEVVIVGRGGGSWEDLWSFNEEIVVRAIVASKVPIVSAVGHETDVTLADFAADHRAPTPSAAAEAVVPVLDDIVDRMNQCFGRLSRAMRMYCLVQDHRLRRVQEVFGAVRRRMQMQAQQLDDVTSVLFDILRSRLQQIRHDARNLRHELASAGPIIPIRQFQVLLPQLVKRLDGHMRSSMDRRRQLVYWRMAALDSLSPLAILNRGYSILHRDPDNTVIKSATEVKAGDLLRARLALGELWCQVKESPPHSQA
jgi:exodeoxyribonuclease VII large subunit